MSKSRASAPASYADRAGLYWLSSYGLGGPLPQTEDIRKTIMTGRLVDGLDGSGNVRHTCPISLGEAGNADDSRYLAKALDAAAEGRLVPDDKPGTLTARMHTARGGQMAPLRR
jgi:hypothetical protein